MKKNKLAVTPHQLCPGLYVILPVRWAKHPFVFNRFKIRSQKQVAIIQSLGLDYVLVVPERSDTKPLEPPKKPEPAPAAKDEELDAELAAAFALKEQQIARQKAYMRGLQNTEQDFQRALVHTKAVMQDMQRRPQSAFGEGKAMVSEIVRVLTSQSDVVLHLMNEPKTDDGFYCHSLNVAVLAMLIARTAGMSEAQMVDAGLGGLFHDLGKSRLPSQILRKTEPLTEAEQNFLKLHTQYGYELAGQYPAFPDAVRKVMLQHHEALDGTGYPKGLKGEEIAQLARLVAVANEYDNLCHGRRQEPGMSPHAVLSHLYKHEQHRLDQVMVQYFIRVLGVYPPGTLVQLNDDQYGLVMTVNSAKLLSPAVLVYDPAVPREQAAIIDLEEAGLAVSRTVKATALPQAVFDYLKPRSHISYYMEAQGGS